jgi:hypothetical protein
MGEPTSETRPFTARTVIEPPALVKCSVTGGAAVPVVDGLVFSVVVVVVVIVAVVPFVGVVSLEVVGTVLVGSGMTVPVAGGCVAGVRMTSRSSVRAPTPRANAVTAAAPPTPVATPLRRRRR